MIRRIANSSHFRKTALVLLIIFIADIVRPTISFALTSGPTQPETQSFEPVSTTDMVDLFTGDFTYNIPLLDVEGYPINIAYHSGANVEQEASWVGLGWNINPGSIVRNVRGVPDDFNGDLIEKEINIRPEKNTKVNVGVSAEVAGLNFLRAHAGLYVNSSNYKGLSAGTSIGANIQFGMGQAGVNMGVNIGVGSQSGADIDLNASMSYSSSQRLSKEEAGMLGFGVGGATGYNSRGGWKDPSLSGNVSLQRNAQHAKFADHDYEDGFTSVAQASVSTTIPIGLQNFVPVITNRSTMTAISGKLGAGTEFYALFPHADLGLTYSKLEFDTNGNRDAYGYLNLQNSGDNDIQDFTRDRDGTFNKTMPNLPSGNMTYDIYSASAQGGGGLFRPFRNDFGSVYDPLVVSDQNENHSVGIEAGFGNLFEVGADYVGYYTDMKSGPWADKRKGFLGKQSAINNLYEPTYFKQAGELTQVNNEYYNEVGKTDAVLNINGSSATSSLQQERNPRGRLLYYHDAVEASNPDISSSQYIENYTDANGLREGVNVAKSTIDRIAGVRKSDQISEIVQLSTDGTRFNYGIPAMNNVQREYAFNVSGNSGDASTSTVSFGAGDNTSQNDNGMDHYYSSTITPAYAHSYLLTSVLSSDYVDVKGDGITDDDLGTFTKFNYHLQNDDYRWRMPYQKEISDREAQYNRGYLIDPQDDKGYYTVGSKEIWNLHSIETKNYCAEFYTSDRLDGLSAKDNVLNDDDTYGKMSGYGDYKDAKTSNEALQKLDSIVLYNKHDRYINGANATPIKTVIFTYDYSLCQGVPNNSSSTTGEQGKLTLRKIYTKYGHSDKNTISPYQFTYSTFNPDYNLACKDRWGNYKAINTTLPTAEYPYVDQADGSLDQYASAWLLTKVKLPSGGDLEVEYEADDYAYVQDKRAMEMFPVTGVGERKECHSGTSLYKNHKVPYSYIYFQRKVGNEVDVSSIVSKYLENQSTIYYNFAVDIRNKKGTSGEYEPVRGYAKILEVGQCPNNSAMGYIKIQSRDVHKSNAVLNPITYNALNVGRHNLNYLFYPGSDPNESDLNNIIKGMAGAAKELANIFQNPMKTYTKQKKARKFSSDKSFVRLMTPSMKKKGGGSRVKSLVLNDAWSGMITSEGSSSYGSTYEYTKDDAKYGEISSGVASYEPMAGADENPFRQLASRYKATQGSKFPPNEPIELLQEAPLGESLYPSPRVGYSRVEVKSIHAGTARSAKVRTISEFYTAKDFPLQTKSTGIRINESKSRHRFFNSEMSFKAEQGYSLIFNDMHGKPKRTQVKRMRDVNDLSKDELVSSVYYKYKMNDDGTLNNTVPVIQYDNSQGLVVADKILGQEIDVTQDCREKTETTSNVTLQLNLNCFLVGFFPVPLPTGFGYGGSHTRNFNSNVITKVVQQYGILEEVETISENAKTVMKNEIFDPVSGRTLMSSINNEFRDREYTMNYPAYWGEHHLAGAYQNIGFEEDDVTIEFGTVTSNSNKLGLLISGNPKHYNMGDEIILDHGGTKVKVWVVEYGTSGDPANPGHDCYPVVDVRDLNNPPSGWGQGQANWTGVKTKVIRSGMRNLLNYDALNVVSLDHPIDGSGRLRFDREKTIQASAANYKPAFGSDTRVKIPYDYSYFNYTSGVEYKYNPFVSGSVKYGNYRTDYVYRTKRDYGLGHTRSDGVFEMDKVYESVSGMQGIPGNPPPNCVSSQKRVMQYASTPSVRWVPTQTGTWYSPYGTELQNTDITGVSSSAHYGYDQTLTTAVISNARVNEFLYDGFEDYDLLKTAGLFDYHFSPFKHLFSKTDRFTGSTLYKQYVDTGGTYSINNTVAHSGISSLQSGSSAVSVNIPMPLSGNHITHYEGGCMKPDAENIISIWVKKDGAGAITAPSVSVNDQSVVTNFTLTAKTKPIEGWVLYEAVISPFSNFSQTLTPPVSVTLSLPALNYYDDIRLFPNDANMKSYAYHPLTHKLMATLDENNFATFYEYDQEGILTRTKKETEKGVLTLKETRMSKKKTN